MKLRFVKSDGKKFKFVTAKGRFAHLLKTDGSNTICGAHPAYYGGALLEVVDWDKVEKMHHCKKCLKLIST